MAEWNQVRFVYHKFRHDQSKNIACIQRLLSATMADMFSLLSFREGSFRSGPESLGVLAPAAAWPLFSRPLRLSSSMGNKAVFPAG